MADVPSELVMAVSGNFLDETNLQCAMDELTFLGITDGEVKRLIASLQAPGFDSKHHDVVDGSDPAGGHSGDGGWSVSWDAFKSGNYLTF